MIPRLLAAKVRVVPGTVVKQADLYLARQLLVPTTKHLHRMLVHSAMYGCQVLIFHLQDQNAGPQTAPATQSHPINYAANSRPTNDQQAMTSSMNTVNSSTALAQPSISQAPSDSQSSISPLNANRGMPLQTARDPERWRHMMEVSRIFQSHVNEMITGIENEDDNAEDFGLGEIRRRPIGAWYD